MLSMGQKDQLSKEEAGEILDQQVHMVSTTQEIRHSIQNFLQLTEDYVRTEGPLYNMATWSFHIDCFERQYDKAFSGDCLFGAYIVDRIHKQVQVFLHLRNTTSLEDVETGALSEFRELQWQVEWGEWITKPSAWV